MTKLPISNELAFKVMVHTVQISSKETVLSDFEIRNRPYVKDFYIRKNRARYIINPNKYGLEANCVEQLEQIMNAICEELRISEPHFDRIDIAIDTITPFDSLYKINCYLKELFAIHVNSKNSFRSIGDNLRARNTIVFSRDIDLEIYDKYLESGGNDLAKTRIEFRFKRPWRGQGLKESVQRVISMLDCLPGHIASLNEAKTRQLHSRYVIERTQSYDGRVRDLADFTTKYADFIYSLEILRKLHNEVLKGQMKHWLYRYRKSGRVITLISKSMLKCYCGKMQTALRQFANGHVNERLNEKNSSKQIAV